MKKATFFLGVTREVYHVARPKAWKRSGLEAELAIGGGETSKVRDFRRHLSRSETLGVWSAREEVVWF